MYLSSYRVGYHPEQMAALLGDCDRAPAVAVIGNALDALPAPEREAGVDREIEDLVALGLRPVELDLRRYFNTPRKRIASALGRFPLVWVRGGNVFVLRHALASSGADDALTRLLHQDSIVYAGYSAGACVLGPDLRGLEQCDDPEAVRAAYGAPARWDGLGLLDYVIVPHVDSPAHPESEILTSLAREYRARSTAHEGLRDGQAIVIHGSRTAIH